MTQRQIALAVNQNMKDLARECVSVVPRQLKHKNLKGQIYYGGVVRMTGVLLEGHHFVSVSHLDYEFKFRLDFGGKVGAPKSKVAAQKYSDCLPIPVKNWGLDDKTPKEAKEIIAWRIAADWHLPLKKMMVAAMNERGVFFEWFAGELERRIMAAADGIPVRMKYDTAAKNSNWVLFYKMLIDDRLYDFHVNPDIDTDTITDTKPIAFDEQIFYECLNQLSWHLNGEELFNG